MLNTLQIGDYIFVNNLSYNIKFPFTNFIFKEHSTPQYGDIIVFKYPKDPSKFFTKRIVGLPGDVIEIHDKQLYRNGERIIEFYVNNKKRTFKYAPLDNMKAIRIPQGEYFVLGDNRDNSDDSRIWGTIPFENIHGKVFMVLFSWNKIKNCLRFDRIFKFVN